MVTLSTAVLSASMLCSGLLSIKCLLPPNATGRQTWKQDRIELIYHPIIITAGSILTFSVVALHAFVTLTLFGDKPWRTPPPYLNPRLFQWNLATVACLALIMFVGAPLRLAAYGTLGSRFTFNLAPPNELNTKGIYRYVQHPSYTGLLLVIIPNILLFFRWDGALGILIPDAIRKHLPGLGLVANGVCMAFIAYVLMIRIRDEEAMLKDVFGKKWVSWNKATSRFIPGIF